MKIEPVTLESLMKSGDAMIARLGDSFGISDWQALYDSTPDDIVPGEDDEPLDDEPGGMIENYTLLDIADFDARKGFTRWVVPGTGIRLSGCYAANADLWTNTAGALVARFSSFGYVYHYEVRPKGKKPILPVEADNVLDFIQNKLVTWSIGGVDDSVTNM